MGFSSVSGVLVLAYNNADPENEPDDRPSVRKKAYVSNRRLEFNKKSSFYKWKYSISYFSGKIDFSC